MKNMRSSRLYIQHISRVMCSDDHLNKNRMEHRTQCCHAGSIKILPWRVRRMLWVFILKDPVYYTVLALKSSFTLRMNAAKHIDCNLNQEWNQEAPMIAIFEILWCTGMEKYKGCSKSTVPHFLSFFLGNTEINYQRENVQEVCTSTL